MATLYRKYRSKTFGEVIGQDAIVTTLTNQIKLGRISHAYLFSGSRGIGKTSCARIFARAVNCLHPVNGDPCGECEVCKKLSGDNVDIIELDAASNNGVDDARDIREKVKYAPVAGRYKVYIIDEVHMLTGGAFNALLKTIEEPPEHVIFILATTEPQKLPQTILSRCIRFDFSLVPTPVLADHVAKVYDAEGIKYTRDAVEEIARLGEGSVRDALSIADTLAAAAETVTSDVVLRLTGAGDSERIAGLFDAVAGKDVAAALTVVDALAKSGTSIPAVCRRLIDYSRGVMVAKSVGKTAAPSLINASRAALEHMLAAADKYDMSDIARILEELSAAESGLKYSVNPRVFLETTLVKLICSVKEHDDLLKRIAALENNSALSAEQKKNKRIAATDILEDAPPAVEVPTQTDKKTAPAPEKAVPKTVEDTSAVKDADTAAAKDAPAVKDKEAPPAPAPVSKPSPAAKVESVEPKKKDNVFEPAPPPPEPPPEDKQAEYLPPPEERQAPTAVRQKPMRSAGKMPQFKVQTADEGEFGQYSARELAGLELLGKLSRLLRRRASAVDIDIHRLLSRGVEVRERDDAIAFVAPEEVFLRLTEDRITAALDEALGSLGIKKRARIERTEDELFEADYYKAKELFGDGVVRRA